MTRYIALFVLFGLMIGLAYHIEITARPVKRVQAEMQRGDHGH